MRIKHRGVAKLGIALGSGPRGPGFESRHSDQILRAAMRLLKFGLRRAVMRRTVLPKGLEHPRTLSSSRGKELTSFACSLLTPHLRRGAKACLTKYTLDNTSDEYKKGTYV